MKMHASKKNPIRSRIPLIVIALAVSTIGGAQAAWQVTDERAQDYLKQINQRVGNGNVNSRLNDIYDAYRLGSASRAGDAEPEPSGSEKLSRSAQSTASVGTDERCPPARGELASTQRQICQEMIDTERAKYTYSLRMYDLTEKRMRRLKDLEDERSRLGDRDYGKLQDNSNRILALMSLIQIDAQRHRTYMDAYDARMSYLVSTRDALSRQALHGASSPSIGSIGSAVVGGGALALALEAAKSRSRHHFD